MTTREEELRSLEMTRQFLIALLNKTITPKVPKEIRAKASDCLRHYPLMITNITVDGDFYTPSVGKNMKNMRHTMTEERYDKLMTEDSHCVLTEKELNEGWHWCLEWDDLLIHPNDTAEYAFCRCEGFEKFAEEVRRHQ